MNFQKVALCKRGPAYLDVLEGLTGLGLSMFLGVHLIFDATILVGPWTFNNVPKILHEYYLAQIGVPFVIIMFFLHFVLAWRKIPVTYTEIGVTARISGLLKHRDTILWVLQCITGMLILLAGALHFWEITTAGLVKINAISSAERAFLLHYHVFYFLFMACAIAHAAIGVYRLGIKWGSFGRAWIRYAMVVFAVTYFVMSVFAIDKFKFRGEEQVALKQQIMEIQTLACSNGDLAVIEAKKEAFYKKMDSLKLEYATDENLRDLVEYLRLGNADQIVPLLKKSAPVEATTPQTEQQ